MFNCEYLTQAITVLADRCSYYKHHHGGNWCREHIWLHTINAYGMDWRYHLQSHCTHTYISVLQAPSLVLLSDDARHLDGSLWLLDTGRRHQEPK